MALHAAEAKKNANKKSNQHVNSRSFSEKTAQQKIFLLTKSKMYDIMSGASCFTDNFADKFVNHFAV